jgi:hypothetical protein
MAEPTPDAKLVAACGLYCGACRAHLRGRCPGCRDNVKATWCKIRECVLGHGWSSCAECADHPDPKSCPKFDNVISRIIGFVLRSNRAACIAQIREVGLEGHAERMARERRQSIRR